MTVSAPLSAVRALPRALRSAGRRAWDQVRQQFITRNRRVAAGLTLVAVVISIAAVHVSAWWFSPGVLILPILCGGLDFDEKWGRVSCFKSRTEFIPG